MRLDKYIIEKGIVQTREKAQELIKTGAILLDGKICTKCSKEVDDSNAIQLCNIDLIKYVSRGGLKLETALENFDFDVSGKTCVDVGSSTGGFADCLLAFGAKKVVCVDNGSNQLAEKLRKDARIVVYENTDFQSVEPNMLQDCEVATCDVSFVSIQKLMPTFAKFQNLTDLLVLFKPQFEVGPELARQFKGVINSQKLHLKLLVENQNKWNENGFALLEICPCKIKGKSGNVEYMLHLRRQAQKQMLSANVLQKVISKAYEK